MHPIICQIGPFTIYSYGLMLVFAFLAATMLAGKQAKLQNINPDIIFNLCFAAFISGVIGARLLYVFQYFSDYIDNPLEIIMLQRGGLSWFGGLSAGVLAAVVYLKLKRLSVYAILDLISPYLALGQAMGRIGCFLNGCCFGKISEFGLYFPAREAVLIPTQIYSSLLLVIIFIILRILQEKPHKSGQIFYSYLVLYSLKRFFMEFFRADNEIVFLNLTFFQLVSVAVFLLAAFKLTAIRKF